MRSSLFAAVALGPLWLAVAATPAGAATTISGTQSTAVQTATANNGQPDDVTINSGAQINLTTAGPALILNSNNAVSNAGVVQINNVSNSTTVQINGGVTGSFTNTGTVQNIEDFTPTDSNADGVFEEPLAQGTARTSIRVTGTSPFVGTITNSGSIFTEGNDSAGVSIEAPVQGSLIHSGGTISVTGDRSFGIRTTAPISGDVNLSAPVETSGQGATAVSIGGDVGGAVRIYSTVSSNAYSTAARSTVETTLKTIQGTPAEQEQAGPALSVGANLASGLYVGAAPVGTASGSTADVDGDGVPDGSEGAGTVSVFGSSPAIVVGGVGRSVNLGAFGTGANAYGMILRGTVTAEGLYDGISATGVQIGGTGGTASLTGGLRLVGTIGATAYEAAATGLHLGAGAVVPELRNENAIGATILRSTVSPAATATATAVQIDAGAAMPLLTNFGVIAATASGPTVNASALVDQSGSLRTINNQGQITASVASSIATETATGRAIALDLRANTSGVTLSQTTNPSPITLAVTTDSSGATTASATTPVTPSITGDVLLGSGPNTVNLLGGTIAGALGLGSNTASLTIDNGANYTGALSYTGSALTINVANGTLVNTNPATIRASSLNIGAASTVSFAVDPVNARSTSYQVSGPATIANGAKIGVNLVSSIAGAQTYTLITSPALNIGSVQSLLPETPYISVANLSLDPAAGALQLSLRRKTAAEAGLNPGETAAFAPIFAALPQDAAMLAAVDAQTTREGFIGLYDQLVPDYSGGLFRLVSAASRAVSRAAAEGGAGNSWIQEITVANQLRSSQAGLPFHGTGFGLAGGFERDSRIGALGATVSLFSGDVHNPDLPSDDNANASVAEAGLTWRAAVGGLRFDANGRVGYVHYRERRQFLVLDSTGATTLSRSASGVSSGWTAAGRFGVSYRAGGRLYVEPTAHIDYFRLSQGAYTETGGGNGFDLALDRRSGDEVSGTVALRLGATLGDEFLWRPELEFGYRDIVSGQAGTTVARFVAGGDAFSLAPVALDKGGAFGQVGVTGGDQFFDLSVAAGAESRGSYREEDLKFRVRVMF